MSINKKTLASLLLTALMLLSPYGYATEGYPRTGLTASYFTGYSRLLDVNGFDSPRAFGYQIGLQGDILGITIGQSSLGRFNLSGPLVNFVDVDSSEVLINLRTTTHNAAMMFYFGVANWNLKNTTTWSQNASAGTSPVWGVGFKLGNNLGLLLTALYYEAVTDSDIVTVNIGFNF